MTLIELNLKNINYTLILENYKDVMRSPKFFLINYSFFLVYFVPSEIAVSAHASRKISQICMGANTRLHRCEILIIAGLAHSFAIVYFRLMRTAVYLLSSPGSSKLPQNPKTPAN